MPTINCRSCGESNNLAARFCRVCGASLRLICPRCKAENLLDAAFCEGCGIKIKDATIGFPINRAQKWAQYFSEQGFGVHQSWIDWLNGVLRKNSEPCVGENKEVRILPLHIAKKDSWLKAVKYTTPEKSWLVTKGLLLVTNCRLFLLDDETNKWGNWSFDRFRSMNTQGERSLTLRVGGEQSLDIYFSPPKPGFGSIAGAIFLDAVVETMTKTRTHTGANTVSQTRSNVSAIHQQVVRFFYEVVEYVQVQK